MRSTVLDRTRFVTWSQERRVPVRVRPSPVRIRTFSGVTEWSVMELARDNSIAYCSHMNEETLYSQLAGLICKWKHSLKPGSRQTR